MEFNTAGVLTYGALEQGTWQVILLTYLVSGSKLLTSQPSAPREEATFFSLLPDGKLELGFGGVRCTLERIKAVAYARAPH